MLKGSETIVIKITPGQSRKVNVLVRRLCCNCVHGNCLLLDDGDETKCVQLIAKRGIYCNHFKNAVLPADKDLYEKIVQQNKLKTDWRKPK
jgi:hypothetical protein